MKQNNLLHYLVNFGISNLIPQYNKSSTRAYCFTNNIQRNYISYTNVHGI